MNWKILFISFMITPFMACYVTQKKTILDKNLIIPGKSAEGYNLGDSYENNINKTIFSEEKDISEILNINYITGIKFNSLVYNRDSSILFLQNDIIKAIAGIKIERRVTSDAILLSRGVDNFILNFGNSKLLTFNDEKHKVYYYKDLGIILFDDYGDDTINMFIVFIK